MPTGCVPSPHRLNLFYQTSIPEILQGAGVKRCGEALEHPLLGQAGKGRMLPSQFIEIFKNNLGEDVYDPIRDPN